MSAVFKDNAKAKRKCAVCGNEIEKKSVCLQFNETFYGRNIIHNVCADCMRRISDEEFTRRMKENINDLNGNNGNNLNGE